MKTGLWIQQLLVQGPVAGFVEHGVDAASVKVEVEQLDELVGCEAADHRDAGAPGARGQLLAQASQRPHERRGGRVVEVGQDDSGKQAGELLEGGLT